jgi:membrane-associated phospholipid phosphatase
VRELIAKYKHGWVLLYFFIYMIWFFALEKSVTTNYTPIHIKLDNYIPFNEWFVLPYFLWFFYIFLTVAFFFLTNKDDFYKICAFLFIGMTICLIIYTIWPNGQNLRPDLTKIGRDNILIRMVATLYSTDTSTNVFPSIHVFNSIGAHIAIHRSETLKKYKWIQWSSFILMILICLSTMFLKQHSAFDSIGAIALSLVMYLFVYSWSDSKVSSKVEDKEIITNIN